MARKQFPCMVCEKLYVELEEAEVCEQGHTTALKIADDLGRDAACAFCSQTTDPCGCVDGRTRPEILSPATLLKLGALTIEVEQSQAVEAHLDDQRIAYEEALRIHGPQGLITALLERDQLLLEQGRTIADGRMFSRMVREYVRAQLYKAGGRPNVLAAEKVLAELGNEPADLRQLALHGSTLGPLEAPEKVANQLASGEKKSR